MPANTDIILRAGQLGGGVQDRLRQLHADSHAELMNTLKIQALAHERNKEDRLSQLYAKAGGAPDISEMGRSMIQAGYGKEGVDLMKSGASIAASGARQKSAETRGEISQFEKAKMQREAMLAHLQGVTDQASLDRGAEAARNDPRLKGLKMEIPGVWNEDTARQLHGWQQSLMTIKQQEDLKLDKQRMQNQVSQFGQSEARQAAQFQAGQDAAESRFQRGQGPDPDQFERDMARAGIEPGSEEYRRLAKGRQEKSDLGGVLAGMLGDSQESDAERPALRLETNVSPEMAEALRGALAAAPGGKQRQAQGVLRRLAAGKISREEAADELEAMGL